jgi:CheY-like chemotaxis protein
MNGLSVLQQIRTLDPAGIVVILTGTDTLQLEQDAKKLGAAEVLQKGLSLHTIGDTVGRLLGRAGVIPPAPFPGDSTKSARSQPERRKHPRIPVQLYAALLREGVAFGDGEIVDLSLTGCAIRTLATIEQGDYLAMQILDPLGRAAQDDCIPFGCELAVARWANEPNCGLEFILMTPEDKDRLRRYVKILQDQVQAVAAT